MEIEKLTLAEAATPELDAFLAASPTSTVFWSPGWNRVIAETYGHRHTYYVARENGAIAGVLLVAAVRHPLFGTKHIAQPYQFDSGAPLAASADVARALVESAAADARAANSHYLEIRHTAPLPWLGELGFESVDAGLVTTVVPVEGIELSSIRRGHRRNIKRAFDSGLEMEETTREEDLRLFRSMYLRENRDLAAPQAGWDYFARTREYLGDRFRLWLSRKDGEVVGGIFTLDDGRTAFARCAVQNSPLARDIHLGKAQIFHTMSAAAERGCSVYNLGISWVGDEGLLANKEGWRGETLPVCLHVLPIKKPAPAPGGYFEGFQLAKAAWRRLPLPIADWAGARITRWIC